MSKLTVDIVGSLSAVPYLTKLPHGDRDRLAERCSVLQVPKGGRAFTEGDPPTGVFLILSGRMQLVRASAGGREQVLHEEGPGMTLGEVPVFDGDGYVGSAIATTPAALLFVPRAALVECLERNPACATEVIRVLAARVRKFATLVEDLSLRDVTQRTAMYLLRESERASADSFDMPESRDRLAARLGTVREQISRTLSRLRRDGIIELQGRMLRILDVARLRQLAEAPQPREI